MIGVLIMLNNYFHDFATALVLVCSYSMALMVKYSEDKGKDIKHLVVSIYPKMLHMNVGSVIFLLFAGIVRAFTFSDFEWVDAVGKKQVPALILKHILLFLVFFYGLYIWKGVHKKIQEFRKETGL